MPFTSHRKRDAGAATVAVLSTLAIALSFASTASPQPSPQPSPQSPEQAQGTPQATPRERSHKPAGPMPDACTKPTFSRPFADFRDRHWYTPVPNHGLEEGAARWTLADGAATAAPGRPDGGGSRSLRLPPKSTAVTAPVCVGVHYPFFRFFARNAGTRKATLRVEVIAVGPNSGRVHHAGDLKQSGDVWKPSRRYPLPAGLFAGAEKRELAPVIIRFTSRGAKQATWRIDDVYVDPWARG